MFILVNLYCCKSGLSSIVYKEKYDCFTDAKDNMEGQVEDAIVNHYSEIEEDGGKISVVREDKYNVHIYTEGNQDWWTIIEV